MSGGESDTSERDGRHGGENREDNEAGQSSLLEALPLEGRVKPIDTGDNSAD